jgi:hypothetical protein
MQAQLIQMAFNTADVVYTPDDVARDVVDFFKPSGLYLDPCKGDGAFLQHLPAGSEWCEVEEGRDFFAWQKPVDWIVGNPPYSMFVPWLQHSFDLADNIVYMIPVNKPFNSNRLMRWIWSWGWMPTIYVLGHGSLFKQNLGFAIGAVHFQRGYHGGTQFCFRSI